MSQMNEAVKRCSRCILPTHLPGMTTDDRGVCSYCRADERAEAGAPKESAELQWKRLEAVVESVRGGREYDCLVPVSGGKDSMYVLWLLKRKFNLNILAYNFDNGFQSANAQANIQRAVKKLGVELIVFKPPEDVLFTLYRTFLLRTGEFCSPCNMMIGALANRIARQNRILYIAKGGASKYSSAVQGASISKYCDRRYYLQVIKGRVDQKLVSKYVLPPPLLNSLRRLAKAGPSDFHPLNYVHPGSAAMRETLMREVDWQPTSEELEHGDCRLNPLKDHLVNQRWGCSELTQAYSSRVRRGEMTREEALRLAEEEEPRALPRVCEEFLTKIGVSEKELKEAQARHFTEIPNYSSSSWHRLGRKAWHMLRK